MKSQSIFSLIVFTGIFGFINFCPAQSRHQLSAPADNIFLKGATWISDNSGIPESDSLFYSDHPAPLFRTEFTIGGEIQKAELWITAAGYYETWLNGNRLGDQQLDPAWTDFSKRIYVTPIDVTSSVQMGKNSWGIMTGNGFYNPLPLRMWGSRNLRNDLPVGNPCVIARLVVTLKDGKTIEQSTSGKWLTKPGPVTRNNVYLGEWYDARKEISGWCMPGTDLTGWEPVKIVPGPGGKMELSDFPPIRITKWINPVKISRKDDSRQIIDFGQNFAGFIRVRIKAQRGDTVRFRYGELIYPDGSLNPMTTVCGQIKRAGVGGPGAPAIAEQMDVYVANGNAGEVYQPRFTFHGFRYVEVTGFAEILAKSEIQGCRINTAVEETFHISSSSGFLNQLNQNCQWTFLSNLQSVQSDCPAREKFGYGGDINATAEAYIYNFNMHGIYRKIILDWADAMNPKGFVDTAPFVGIEYCGLSWESAFLFLQEALWIHYGDDQLIKDLYKTDQAWMEKVMRIHPGLVVDSGLSDHESLAKVPVELTGTCHYYQLARIMERFALVCSDDQGAVKYSELAGRIGAKIIDLFWDTPEIEVPNKQTLLATLLASGVLNAADQEIAMERLLTILEESDYHVTTGIFGTKNLLEALSAHGRTDIAFRTVNQSGFPGWRYMVDNGATTLWETWKESDNTFSQNHPMFGSVSEWYIKWLGGIQPDKENPSAESVVLKPRPVMELDSLVVEKQYPSGPLVSRWSWVRGALRFEFSIPDGVKADWIPAEPLNKITVIQSPAGWKSGAGEDSGRMSLTKKGVYVFEVLKPGN